MLYVHTYVPTYLHTQNDLKQMLTEANVLLTLQSGGMKSEVIKDLTFQLLKRPTYIPSGY